MLCEKPVNMIEVFKTNVEEAKDAGTIVQLLLQQFPGSRINFDLQDCDKILRVEGKDFSADKVMVLGLLLRTTGVKSIY
jgi:hypothetical protein